ncbi:hypothetical protein PG985_008104 [Apiospora marii]|uniref:uncharacterized protein n=1 Tax=Apiospora marii TaxID=335849 RepID=UPI00313009B2
MVSAGNTGAALGDKAVEVGITVSAAHLSHERLDATPSSTTRVAHSTWELEADQTSRRESRNKAFDARVSGAHAVTAICMPLALEIVRPAAPILHGRPIDPQATCDDNLYPNPTAPRAGWPRDIHPNFETMTYRPSKSVLNTMMIAD